MNLQTWLYGNYFLFDNLNTLFLKIHFFLLFLKLFELLCVHDLSWFNKLSREFLIFIFILCRNSLLLHTRSIFKWVRSLSLILRLNFYRLLDCSYFMLDHFNSFLLKIRFFLLFFQLFEFLSVHDISWFNKLPREFLIFIFVICCNSFLFFAESILSWPFLRLSQIKRMNLLTWIYGQYFLFDNLDTLFLKICLFLFFFQLFEFLSVHDLSWFNKLTREFLIPVFVICFNRSLLFAVSILSWLWLRISQIKRMNLLT